MAVIPIRTGWGFLAGVDLDRRDLQPDGRRAGGAQTQDGQAHQGREMALVDHVAAPKGVVVAAH